MVPLARSTVTHILTEDPFWKWDWPLLDTVGSLLPSTSHAHNLRGPWGQNVHVQGIWVRNKIQIGANREICDWCKSSKKNPSACLSYVKRGDTFSSSEHPEPVPHVATAKGIAATRDKVCLQNTSLNVQHAGLCYLTDLWSIRGKNG